MEDAEQRPAAPHDIFISYASRDQDAADRIVRAIEQRGMRCWISSRDIKPGTDYQGSIVSALEQCSIVVLVFSQNTNASSEVPKEMSLASSRRKPIIPARIEDVMPAGALAYQLTHAQFTDLFRNFDSRLSELCSYLDDMLKAAGNTERRPQAAAARPVAGLLALMAGAALLTAGAAVAWAALSGRVAPPWLSAVLHVGGNKVAPLPPAREAPPGGGVQPGAAQADTVQMPEGKPEMPTPVDPADQLARNFVLSYYAMLSQPADTLLPFLTNAAGARLNFYGQNIPRSRLLTIEGSYVRKWPERRFTILPQTLHSACAGKTHCLVTGVVDYELKNVVRNAAALGAENFSVGLNGIGTNPTITDIVGVAVPRHGDAAQVAPRTGQQPGASATR